MFKKIQNYFQQKSLTCTRCGQAIEEGQHFQAYLTMPSEFKMPVARLDVGIRKCASEIICSKCGGER